MDGEVEGSCREEYLEKCNVRWLGGCVEGPKDIHSFESIEIGVKDEMNFDLIIGGVQWNIGQVYLLRSEFSIIPEHFDRLGF